MKKVLIIANLYYATPRITGICKYLPKFGWHPTIVTPPKQDKPTHTHIIETDGYTSKYGRKSHFSWLPKFVKTWYKEVMRYPDAETKWIPHALKAIENLLQTEHFDAVISSSSPATCHIIAKQVTEKHKLPWIADFRDPWTQNFNYPYTRIRRWRERKLELQTMATADRLVSISEPYAKMLNTLHHKPSYSVLNGYDPDDYIGTVPVTRNFTVTHTGNLYPELELDKFERGYNAFGAGDLPSTQLRFYGPQTTYLPHNEVVQKQRESQVLLLYKYKKSDNGYFTGKIYEYLAAQRPILAVGGNHDSISELLKETNAGYEVYTSVEVTKALDKFYHDYTQYGAVPYHGKPEEYKKYSYIESARKYAAILEEVS